MNTIFKKMLLALASFAVVVATPACMKKDKSETKETTYTHESRGMKKNKKDRDEDKEGKKEKKHHMKKTTKKTVTERDMD